MLSAIILNVVILNAANNHFMLSVIVLNVFMLNAANNHSMLSVIVLSVVMLNVIMLSVVTVKTNAGYYQHSKRL